MTKFINRHYELKTLKSGLKPGALVIVYGRRRVGKTELLKQISAKRKIYYLVKEQPVKKTLSEINNKLIKEFKDTKLLDNPINTLEKLFRYFSDKDMTLVLDEFPLLLKKKDILGQMQEFLDEKPKSSLVLCGSYISAMEKIKDYSSPIYGRRMLSLKVEPLKFSHLKLFFPGAKKEELVKIYATLDGVPEYLLKYRKPFDKFVRDNFFQKDTYLYEEAELLLRYELRDLSNYNSILKAIASGYTTLNEISQKSFVEKSAISKYLDVLLGLGIIKKELPHLSGKKEKIKERGALYFIKDNYYNFYFNFVYPFKEEITLGLSQKAHFNLEKNFNTYLGNIFELIGREFLVEKYQEIFGRQWGNYQEREKGEIITRSYEIDLMSLDPKNKEIKIFEIKWRDLDIQKAMAVLADLEKKKDYFLTGYADYEVKIGIIAKNIAEKEKLRRKGYLVFDLEDM